MGAERLYAPEGHEGVVTDGLHYWDIPLSVPERILPGAHTNYGPLYGPEVPPRRHPEVASMLPLAVHADLAVTNQGANEVRPNLHGDSTGIYQATPYREAEIPMNI